MIMDIAIQFKNGDVATRAEIGVTHIDLTTLVFTIPVVLYSASGDVVYQEDISKVLDGLPIPSMAEQWQIVMPALEAMRQQSTP